MTATIDTPPIDALKRVHDEDAVHLVSQRALAELQEAILATAPAPAPAPESARARNGRRTVALGARRPLLALAATLSVAAVVLIVSGVFSGGGPAETQAADAAVVRGALAALAQPPGSIVIESYRGLESQNPKFLQYAPGYKPPRGIQTSGWSQREITESPVGRGPSNEVNLGGPSVNGGVQTGEVNGNNELYDPKRNTVYISSQYGADMKPGPRPGTFIYTLPKIPNAPAGSAAAEQNAHMPPPLTITAAQARALRDGTAAVGMAPDHRRPTSNHLTITPAFRITDDNAEIRSELKAGKLKVTGPITIDGRRAIKLVGGYGRVTEEYDVAPGTYAPIREIHRSPGMTVTLTYSEYRVLPATAANARLLDLAFTHPTARVDRNHADYLAAQARLITGS
jgi:hypothetical protein